MKKWEDMQIFATVMETLSFTLAAEKLGVSKQFVSRRIMGLEADLNVRLLQRTTRKLSPTTIGYAYHEKIHKVLEEINKIEQDISSVSKEPKGTLRMSCSVGLTSLYLSKVFPKFLSIYPEVKLLVDVNDRVVDLVAEGYDLAIRIGMLESSTLIARKIAPVNIIACCSPDYLKKNGKPEHPNELKNFECLLYGHTNHIEWPFMIDKKLKYIRVNGRYQANNGIVLRNAAIAGMGIGMHPDYELKDAFNKQQLVPILQDFSVTQTAVHAVYPQHHQSSLLVKTMIDFLCDDYQAKL